MTTGTGRAMRSSIPSSLLVTILLLMWSQTLRAVAPPPSTAVRSPLAPALTSSPVEVPQPKTTFTRAGGFWFTIYRNTWSKVRGRACNFTPSCSHYSEEAIARYGFFKGFVMTGDRLQRCQPCLNPLQYPRGLVITPEDRTLSDPVEDHDTWWVFRLGTPPQFDVGREELMQF